VRCATYHSDIPTWISHHSDVPDHNLGHILEHGSWSYSLTWNCSQDKIITLIATEEIVSETSHDLNLNLYLGIAPRARSWLRNMLCNISFVNLILSLIISKQRVWAHVPPHTYLGSTTLLFVICILGRTLRTYIVMTGGGDNNQQQSASGKNGGCGSGGNRAVVAVAAVAA
jgi:hypothetical protein